MEKLRGFKIDNFRRQYLFYIGGVLAGVGEQSNLYFMDLAAKQLGWVLQTGKMIPPGFKGTVLSTYASEERTAKLYFSSPKIYLAKFM